MEKLYLSYVHIHKVIKQCAESIKASGFEPDIILAIGGGGFIPARILRTFLNKPILSVVVAYYTNQAETLPEPMKYQWLDENHSEIVGKNVLLVDEVDDSRTTLEYCLTELLQHKPAHLAVAVLHNKLKLKRGKFPSQVQHVFVGEEVPDKWLCYPWDAKDIDDHEQRARTNDATDSYATTHR